MLLEYYQSLFIKYWKLILVCFVVIGLGANIASRLMIPTYQSSVLVQVDIHTAANTSDYANMTASSQLAQTEVQIAVSGSVLRQVVKRYPGLTADQLAEKTTATPKANTQLFEIAVQDASPTRAASLANDIAATLIEQQTNQTRQDNSNTEQRLQTQIDITRQKMISILAQIAGLQANLTNLQSQKGPQTQINDTQNQIANLQSQLYQLQNHDSQWETMLSQLQLEDVQHDSFLRVIQSAQPASNPIQPQILLNTIIGLISGLFVGLVLAILFEQLDTRVSTVEKLSQLFKWPVLGTIWRINDPEEQKQELVNPKEHYTNIEAYRMLRTNIGFSAIKKPLRTLMVTSALAQDGKSTIAANLAIFMAKAGKRTLLIDADLRHPTVRKKFPFCADKMGLNNALLALSQPQSLTTSSSDTPPLTDMSLSAYIHSVDIPNLHVMPAGPLPPNPPELLSSEAMDHILAIIAKSEIEMIIFDTPPLLGLSDASILAPKVDGVVLVVDITRAHRKFLQQVETILTQAGTRILGCVVNKQSRNRQTMAYYPYYHPSEQENREEKGTQDEKLPILVTSPARSSSKKNKQPGK